MRALAAVLAAWALTAAAPPASDFWSIPRHGANSFNLAPPDHSYFRALRATGATWVRLTPDKWKGQGRDFLIGSADHYAGIPPPDLATLIATIDRADKAGLKVVLVPLSLPGSRWAQNNGARFDGRLWTDQRWWAESAAFWRDLASALRDRPGVVGYNIVNEPSPERSTGLADGASEADKRLWMAHARGTPHDLAAFYKTVIAAIRSVDPRTPIMVDAGSYASPAALARWPEAIDDPHLVYAVHMYDPYDVTSAPNLRRAKPLTYPGEIVEPWGIERWDRARIAETIAAPLRWADAHGVARSRIVVSEFGCVRRLAFCPVWLEDVLSATDHDRLSWAFYSYREDAWDAMDYELGDAPVGADFWTVGGPARARRSPATPQFAPIARRLAADRDRR